jgi:hypothetical protein
MEHVKIVCHRTFYFLINFVFIVLHTLEHSTTIK